MPRLSTLAVAIATLAAVLVTATTSFAAPAAPAAPPPPITPEAKAAGMKAAPALIAAANLPCTLSAARAIGNGKDSKGQPIVLTEIACKDSLGYVVAADAKGQPAQIFDCLMAATTPNLGCRLPENANPAVGVQGLVSQSGRTLHRQPGPLHGHDDRQAHLRDRMLERRGARAAGPGRGRRADCG